MAVTGKKWAEVKEWLEQVRDGSSVASKDIRRGTDVEMPLGVGTLRGPHIAYLKDRGFDPKELVKLWNLRGIGPFSNLPWRLFIPIVHEGWTVSWTTRAIGDSSLRYISARPDQETMALKNILYGADYVRHSVVVCEGPTDAWKIGPGAVATLGTQYTAGQVDWIGKCSVRAICFDREPAAQKRARQLASRLELFPGRTEVIELESGSDVADAEQAEVDQIRDRYLE